MDSFVQKNANPIDRFVSGQNFLNFFVSRRSSEAYLKWFLFIDFVIFIEKHHASHWIIKVISIQQEITLSRKKFEKKSSEKAQIKKCKTFYNSIGEQTIINYNQQ